MSDSQKSRSWLNRFVRSRLVVVLTAAVIASAVGGTAAAMASNSKAKTQGPVVVKGPPLGTFTTTSGNSPTLPTAGTYFVVVLVAIENSGDSPLRGGCGVTQLDNSGDPVPGGFGGAIIIPSGAAARFTFSGMAVVDDIDAPETMRVDCTSETGQTVPIIGADWWVEKVNT